MATFIDQGILGYDKKNRLFFNGRLLFASDTSVLVFGSKYATEMSRFLREHFVEFPVKQTHRGQ